MKRYLSTLPLAEAVRLVRSAYPRPDHAERVALTDAAGRVTVRPIIAGFPVPEVSICAMDGFAVRSRDTLGANDQRPVVLAHAVRVNTGNILPDGCDAVIMIEDVWLEDGRCMIRKPAVPGQHVRSPGEDVKEGEMIFPVGHRIRPFDIGALATYGIPELEVSTIRAGLIPTGGELVPLCARPEPGQVVESNTAMAAAYLETFGITCARMPIVPDDHGQITKAIEDALDSCDLVLVSAGSAAGTRDYTADAIRSLGEVLTHGVAMRPGKPVIIGRVRGKPVIGLPGYPLSAMAVLREIVAPLLDAWGCPGPVTAELPVILGSRIVSDLSMDEFVTCVVGKVRDRYVGIPVSRGSAVQSAVVRSNAYLHIPASFEGIESGRTVTARLTDPIAYIDRAILIAGTHDPALDHLGNALRFQNLFLYFTGGGNPGAVQAIGRSTCHGAAIAVTGKDVPDWFSVWNRNGPECQLTFVCIAESPLGLVSRSGINPGRLEGMRIVNRETGSPARIALDATLHTMKIDPSSLPGYRSEAKSHYAVAAAVSRGNADTGISTLAAARQSGLVFTPVATERYELAIPDPLISDSRVTALIDTLASPDFRDQIRSLGCYDVTETGQVRKVSVLGVTGASRKAGLTGPAIAEEEEKPL
jgi:putative molybdopterin biosynthesis protein